MNVLWGVIVTLLALLAWGGQVVAWLSPETAVRWKVMEAEDDVEPAFWADARGEAAWDTFTLWTMVVAGVLLSVDSEAWPYFGLVGGGMYLYFGGRGITSRAAIRGLGLRIGAPENVRLGFAFSAIWAVMALITIIAAAIALRSR
jgi:hypothetical protein